MSTPAFHLSPLGRGREAMTCGRAAHACCKQNHDGADVSHLAELVRGTLLRRKAPSSALRAPSPQGEKGRVAIVGDPLGTGKTATPLRLLARGQLVEGE